MQEEVLYQGTVTQWQDDKGFGFIHSQSLPDRVFFHISEWKAPTRPQSGEQVQFAAAKDGQGRWRAQRVQQLAFVRRKNLEQWQREKRQQEREAHQAGFKAGQARNLVIVAGFYLLLAAFCVLGRLPYMLLGWYAVIGVLTFAAYRNDKAAAQSGAWRTPESTLHLLSLLGGWGGALLAQTYLRHKSSKTEFRVVYFVTLVLNLAALGWALGSGKIPSFKSFSLF